VRDKILDTEAYNTVMEQMIIEAGVSLRELAQGLWMTYDCLRRLRADGHIVGLHSHTHPIRMELLQADQQEQEYVANHNCLSRVLGEPPQAMSHPCNSYNISTLVILRKLGIRLGFRANMAQVQASELEWPREDHANVLKEMGNASHGVH
jgi:peptidoglycan/xylan/chitin deacetylase (PgdA/CDA1 family)